MMDIRKRIFIGISIIVGIIIIIILFILLQNKKKTAPPVVTPTTSTEVNTEGGTNGTNGTPTPVQPTEFPLRTENADERYLRQLARMVVERVGSFSNQNDNTHISDVDPLITDNFRSWLQTRALPQERDYRGQTTEVIESKVESRSEERATVTIGVQEFIQGNGTMETKYENGRVELAKVNGEWKVDGIFWESQ